MKRTVLILGDLLAIAVITVIGFATHKEVGLSFLPRMAVLYLPLSVAWFVLAPWLGLFRPEVISELKQLWRPALVMIFAVPAALIVRGLFLNAPVLPLFGLILSSICAFGMLIWRLFALLISRARK